MTALVLLCGGLGSRLGSLTKDLPKPLVEINDLTILEWSLFSYSYIPFDCIYIIAGYKGKKLRDRFHNAVINGTLVKVIIEDEPSGSGKAILEIPFNDHSSYCIANGDTFIDFEDEHFISQLFCSQIMGSSLLLLSSMHPDPDQGCISYDKTCHKWFRQDSPNSKFENYLNTGILLLSRAHLVRFKEYVSNNIGKKLGLHEEVLDYFLENQIISPIVSNSRVYDLGTPQRIKFFSDFISSFKRSLVLFDKDNTLVHDYGHSVDASWNLEVLSRAKTMLQLGRNKLFFGLYTNQSGIARGNFSCDELLRSFRILRLKLLNNGILLHKIFYCPHHPLENCSCRKPNPNFLKQSLGPLPYECVGYVGDSQVDKKFADALQLPYIDINSHDSIINFTTEFL